MNSMRPSTFLARAFRAPSVAQTTILRFAGLLGSTLAPLAVFQTVPVVTWLAPSAITYWNNYLTTLTDQFCQTFLDAPSFNN
jgi:hypothetical protein